MKDACCMRWGRRSRSECVFPSEVCVKNFALAVKLLSSLPGVELVDQVAVGLGIVREYGSGGFGKGVKCGVVDRHALGLEVCNEAVGLLLVEGAVKLSGVNGRSRDDLLLLRGSASARRFQRW